MARPIARDRCTFSLVTAAKMLLLAHLLFPTPAAAQQDCNIGYGSSDVSVTGRARMQASTTNPNVCQGITVEVRARIPNAVAGDRSKSWYNNYCRDTNGSGGNAVVTVSSQGCGTWYGYSNHFLTINGQSTTIAQDLQKTLYAGSCQVECPPGWQPDGFGGCYEPSPIIIATDKCAKYELTSAKDGVAFDIDGDGAVEQVAWTAPGSGVAFLALDRDGNGLITSGKELFGNNTLPGVMNGFDALLRMSMETNGGIMRGSVSSDDPLFARLLLWTDVNHNGFSEGSELRPASGLLSDIGLGYNVSNRKDQYGNLFRFFGWAHIRTDPGPNRARSKKVTG